jgi:uncharacterized protein YprB with RNaseH-like and TPR domain/predicted nuclease with RNAse H fold/dephospho-CoA kinase
MLQHTFQHFRGISAKKERELWTEGVFSWEQYEQAVYPQRNLFAHAEDGADTVSTVRESVQALLVEDTDYFASRLDRNEHYRIALAAPEKTLFLDIETTGLSRYYDTITVIGWSMGHDYGFFVKGQDDSRLRQVLKAAKVLVTFNGTLFDVPFIAHEYPDLVLPKIHVDLRFLARRAGLTGGQKEIERILGVKRDPSVTEVAGVMAPVLWHDYTRGDAIALERLLKYNAADIRGMKHIMDVSCETVVSGYGFPCKKYPLFKLCNQDPIDWSASIDKEIRLVARPWPRQEGRKLRLDDMLFVDRAPRLRVVGIDLTGSEKRPSGWCLLDGREVVTAALSGDEEIIARTAKENPHVVSIDSPMSLPEGRTSVFDDDPGRAEFGIMRFCERVLKRRGVNVYPALIPSMQRLTARGTYLASRFRSMGFPVIESYPGAAQDIMGIPRKQKGLAYLEQGLAEFGVSGTFVKESVSHDELDAITSAIVGVFFWAGQVERLGPDPLGEEALFIPDLKVDAAERRNRLIVGLSGALGAGKTTAARHLEQEGFTYCRYSQVIERLVKAQNADYSRADLQVEGQRVHVEMGQRWLGRELVRPLLDSKFLVIDGLRFPDDHAFLTEVYGSQFLHIHVVARKPLRKARYEEREHANFEIASGHAVEGRVGDLNKFARDVVENNGSVVDYHRALDNLLRRQWG